MRGHTLFKKAASFFRTEPDSVPGWFEWFCPIFIGMVLLYSYHSWSVRRTAANPMQKLTPTIDRIFDGFKRYALEPDKVTQKRRMVVDLKASAFRYGVGLGISIVVGATLGLLSGCFPFMEAIFRVPLVIIHKVPAISLLPILFCIFGTGELAKVVLIVLAVLPALAVDSYLRVKEIPRQIFYKAQTLGATEPEICFRIIWPMIFPKVLDAIRLNLGPALLLLIAAEGISADAGMGYRIFVIRRYFAVDVILAYVIVMTAIMFLLDLSLSRYIKSFRWLGK